MSECGGPNCQHCATERGEKVEEMRRTFGATRATLTAAHYQTAQYGFSPTVSRDQINRALAGE